MEGGAFDQIFRRSEKKKRGRGGGGGGQSDIALRTVFFLPPSTPASVTV